VTPKDKLKLLKLNQAFGRQFDRERKQWPDGKWFVKPVRSTPVEHYLTDIDAEKLRRKQAFANRNRKPSGAKS
jgi:hypothetical protein